MAGKSGISPIVPHVDFLCAVGTYMMIMLVKDLICDPWVAQRLIGERLTERGGGTVRRVWIPVMDMQAPVILICMAGEPVQSGRRYLIGSFHTAATYITGLVKPSVEPPRCV